MVGVDAKVVAVEKDHGNQFKAHKQKDVFLEDEKEVLAEEVGELDNQLQQHMYQAHLLTLLPPIYLCICISYIVKVCDRCIIKYSL